jgi:hypothetical protein
VIEEHPGRVGMPLMSFRTLGFFYAGQVQAFAGNKPDVKFGRRFCDPGNLDREEAVSIEEER